MSTENLKSPTEIEVHHMDWMGVPYIVTWKPEYLTGGIAHLEIRTDNNSPIPITKTGYRSHFIPREVVDEAG